MTVTHTYSVGGMTCGHCVSAVRQEISAIAGVTNVEVDLRVGETSPVVVASDTPLDVGLVREAVAEAGYTLVAEPK